MEPIIKYLPVLQTISTVFTPLLAIIFGGTAWKYLTAKRKAEIAKLNLQIARLNNEKDSLNDRIENLREKHQAELANGIRQIKFFEDKLKFFEKTHSAEKVSVVLEAQKKLLDQVGEELRKSNLSNSAKDEINKKLRRGLEQSRQVIEAIGKLQSDLQYSEKDRSDAALQLGEVRDVSAVPALIEAMDGVYKLVSESASKALVQIGEPAVPGLIHDIVNYIKLLKDQNRWDNELDISHVGPDNVPAASVLLQIGEPAMPALKKLLSHKDEWVCEMAKKILSDDSFDSVIGN